MQRQLYPYLFQKFSKNIDKCKVADGYMLYRENIESASFKLRFLLKYHTQDDYFINVLKWKPVVYGYLWETELGDVRIEDIDNFIAFCRGKNLIYISQGGTDVQCWG
jgi:hypothetical protein